MSTLKVCVLCMGPTVARGLKVLSPSPYFLASYANWRFKEENLSAPNIEPTVFEAGLTGLEIAQRVIDKGYDVVAFSVYIWNCQELFEAGKLIKEALPETVIIFGGPQVSPIAEDIIEQYDFIDIIPFVTAPGEPIFYDIVKAIMLGAPLEDVSNIFFRSNKSIVKTIEKIEKVDFEAIPSPYLDGTVQIDNEKCDCMVIIESSRGCPFACAYCFWGSGGTKMTYYPTDRTIEEIRDVYSHPSVKQVYFADSDFLIKPDRANVILDAILEYGGDRVISGFEIDANLLREAKREAVEKLAKLPDHKITFAVQTTNPAAHELLGKRAKADQFKKNAEMIRGWVPDIQIYTDVMLPLPGDNLEGFRNTLNFVFSLRPVRFFMNYPLYLLPGTKYFEDRDKLGLIYTDAPFRNVMATTEFPVEDVTSAFKLGICSEIFTYYLPGIMNFFYDISELDTKTRRVDRIQRWMDAVESKLRLFSDKDDLVEQVTQSVRKLNILKGGILRQACMPQGLKAIYETIIELESENFPEITRRLQHDYEIIEKLCQNEFTKGNGDPYQQIKINGPKILKTYGMEITHDELSRFLPVFHFERNE